MGTWSSTRLVYPELSWTRGVSSSTADGNVRLLLPASPAAPRAELVGRLAQKLAQLRQGGEAARPSGEGGRAQLWLGNGVSQRLSFRYVARSAPTPMTVSLPKTSPLDEVLRRLAKVPRQFRN